MHVSLALFQTWRTREDLILDESGLAEMPHDNEADVALRRFSVTTVGNPFGEEQEGETLPDLKRLEEAIEEVEIAIKKAESSADRAEKKRLKERREDLMRLQRVETIYASSFFL